MKTLDEIINRQDYRKLNKALKERAQVIAKKIAEKLYSLDAEWDSRKDDYPPYAVTVGQNQYACKLNIYTLNGEKSTDGVRLVVLKDNRCGREVKCYSLCCLDYGTEANHEKFLNFLNDAREIIDKIDEFENSMVEDINSALEASANL